MDNTQLQTTETFESIFKDEHKAYAAYKRCETGVPGIRFTGHPQDTLHTACAKPDMIITSYTPVQSPDIMADKKQRAAHTLYSIFHKYHTMDAGSYSHGDTASQKGVWMR